MSETVQQGAIAYELLTLEEVALELRLHAESVRRYVRNGRIRAVRFGRNYRVYRGEVERVKKEGVPMAGLKPLPTFHDRAETGKIDLTQPKQEKQEWTEAAKSFMFQGKSSPVSKKSSVPEEEEQGDYRENWG